MDLEEKLAESQNQLLKAANFGKQLLNDNQILRQQIEELQSRLAAQNEFLSTSDSADLDAKYHQLLHNYEESQTKISQLEHSLKEMVSRVDHKEIELVSVENRLLELRRHTEEIESVNRSLNQKVKQFSLSADQSVSLQEENEKLRQKLNEMQAKEQAQNRLLSGLEDRLASSEAQLEQIQAKNQDEHEQLLKTIEKMKDEISSKNNRITRLESLQSTLNEMQSQSNELIETIDQLKEENQMLQRQMEMKDTMLAQAKARASASVSLDLNSPARKPSLHSLLASTPSHSRNPSSGGNSETPPTPTESRSEAIIEPQPTPPATPTADSNPTRIETVRQEVIVDLEAQNLLKAQQNQLNNMEAQLKQREKDLADQQRAVMEALTKINLSLVASRPKPPGTTVVLLGNLPQDTPYTPDYIEEFLGDCGEIKSFRWVTKGEDFLGYGFIEFYNTIEADKAVSKNGKVFMHRQISIDYATREEYEALKPVRS